MHGLFLGLPIYSFKHTFRLFSLIFLQLSFTSITGIYLKSNTIMLIILLSTKKYVLSNIFVSFFSNKHHYYRAFVKDLIPYPNMNSYFLLMYFKVITVPTQWQSLYYSLRHCTSRSHRTIVSLIQSAYLWIIFYTRHHNKAIRNSRCGHLYKFTQIKTAPHKELLYNDQLQGILKMFFIPINAEVVILYQICFFQIVVTCYKYKPLKWGS